ncbi:hypothetical protein JKP88DRAFT_333667 [Tribonema minus]|uniref:Uncharacterized protein n=1 Tax=Tribonema minus TaxID=303371 RepID=A0A835YTY1_9STRA|nr:hypothetical protein JKP88DRAFT_333667 [Tribonema minus]
MLKEGANLKFSAGDLTGALRGYGVALGVVLRVRAGICELPNERRNDCCLELAKVNANLSLIQLRRGDADAALERAASAASNAPHWFKPHARRGAALAALRRHAEASAAIAVAADLAATPRDAAECQRQEDAQLQLARDAEALQGIQAQLQQQQLLPASNGASCSAAAADGGPARSTAAAAAAEVASIGRVLGALEETSQGAAAALAGYMVPSDLARLERTCRFFGAAAVSRRVHARRAVRCQRACSLGCRSDVGPAVTSAAAAAAAQAAAAGVEAAVRAYCDAASDADACLALEKLAAALAALVHARGGTPAQNKPVRMATSSVAGADTPAAERYAFWCACAAQAALQELQARVFDVSAVKLLLREPTAPLEAKARSMRVMAQGVMLMQDEFAEACEAGTLGSWPPSQVESFLQQLFRYGLVSEVAASPRSAFVMLATLLNAYGHALRRSAAGTDAALHVQAFGALHAALPPRLPAARAPPDLSDAQSAAIAARLPADATPGAVCAHLAYGVAAADVRAALEADARALRVWRDALRPVGDWLAQPRGEEWGGGARAAAAFERAVGSAEGLAELFAGYYAMVLDYSLMLPRLDTLTDRIVEQR